MKKIVIYGDSNTYGYDPCGMFDRRYEKKDRWPDILSASGKWDVRAYGLNGRQIPQHNADFAYLDQILMNTSPFDLFCILLGSNDLLFMFEPDLNLVSDRMERLLLYLLDRTALERDSSRILLLAPLPFEIREPDAKRHNAISREFPAEWKRLSLKYGTHFADPGEWQIDLAFDGVHFTEKGNHRFAAGMEKVLTGIFPGEPSDSPHSIYI